MNYILALQNANTLLIIGIFTALIVIGVLAYYFNKKNVILRELKKGRRKQVISVRQNEYVKIIGKAIAGNNPITAPLSGRKCVYYHVLIETKADKGWHKYLEEENAQDFFIESGGEMAIVKTDQPNNSKKVFLVEDFEDSSGWKNDAKSRFEDFLRKHNKKSTGFFGGNKTMRYKEGVIAINETIAVKGIGKWKSTNETIEGYSYSRLLTLSGTPKQKLMITDHPKALKRVLNKI